MFQRNSGAYYPDLNPFGTASPAITPSGSFLTAVTGRYDGKFADVVYPEDVVDTRSVVAMAGWDNGALLANGFDDIISGTTEGINVTATDTLITVVLIRVD